MFTTVVAPIVSLLNSLMAPLLAIVGALGALYCVVLGVNYAKAEEPQEREGKRRAEERGDRLYPDLRAHSGPESAAAHYDQLGQRAGQRHDHHRHGISTAKKTVQGLSLTALEGALAAFLRRYTILSQPATDCSCSSYSA